APAVRRPLQPARQPGRPHLGRPDGLPRQHRRHLAGPPTTGPRLLPAALTPPDADRRRALRLALATAAFRPEAQASRTAARPAHTADVGDADHPLLRDQAEVDAAGARGESGVQV